MQDPEYYKLEKKVHVFTHELSTAEDISVLDFMEYIRGEIVRFSASLKFPVFDFEIKIRHRIGYWNYNDDPILQAFELYYVKEETEEDYKSRVTNDLNNMEKVYRRKLEGAEESLRHMTNQTVSQVREDKYKEKRNKALARLMAMSITDPAYMSVLIQVNKYSPEGLAAENEVRLQAKKNSVAEVQRSIARSKEALKKIDTLRKQLEKPLEQKIPKKIENNPIKDY